MEKFELKEEHLKLLQSAYWRWEDCEYGAPAMDCKRPFGNSDVIGDIAKILGIEGEVCPHCGEVLSAEGEGKLDAIYRELLIALRVIFSAQTFKLGIYENTDDYGEKWHYAGRVGY